MILLEIAAFVVVTGASAVGAVFVLASLDLFWTIVKEGEIKVVMSFKDPIRPILNFDGHIMEGWKVIDGTAKRSWFGRLFGGIYWVGIPPFRTIYKYTFRWVTFKMKPGEGGKGGTLEATEYKQETLSSIFAKVAPYVLEITEVEVKGMVRLNLKIVFTACCVNPHKALFVVHDWMITLSNLIFPRLRVIVAKHSFDEIVQNKMGVMQEVSKEMKDELDAKGMINEFRDKFGISIVDFDLSDITASDPKDADLAAAEWRADQEAKAEIAKAKGTKQSTITKEEGVAEAITLRSKAMARTKYGALAAQLRAAENMVGAAERRTILWGGKMAPEELAPGEYLAERLEDQSKAKPQEKTEPEKKKEGKGK